MSTMPPIIDNQFLILWVFLAFALSVIFFSVIKKIYYSVFLKKKLYVIPRLSIRGIGYLGMIIALSVSIIIILTIYTGDIAAVLFRAFPGTRITFESILIKIGGLLLGPLLGMVLGAATDGLTIVFTAGVFHYGYFLAAIAFGLIGGLIRVMISWSIKNKKIFFLSANFLIILSTIAVATFYTLTKYENGGGSISFEDIRLNLNTVAIIPILNIQLKIWQIIFIILGCGFFALVILNGFYFLSKKSKIKIFQNQFDSFGPILLMIFISEMMVSIFMLPVVDVVLVSSITYSSWVTIRVLSLAPMLIFNTLIIWPIYKSISSIFKYDYLNDYIVDENDGQRIGSKANQNIINFKTNKIDLASKDWKKELILRKHLNQINLKIKAKNKREKNYIHGK